MFAIGRKRRAKKNSPAVAPLSEALTVIQADAALGHVAAQTIWAQALLEGAGPAVDARQARIWFGIAAAAGYGPALNMRGRCQERGWGGAIDLPAAAVSYRMAWAAGDVWGGYNLANMALRGRGIPRDRALAWTLFLATAERGHAKSMNLVARFLEEGWDRPVNQRAAAVWYRRSAEAGDYRGMHNLAVLLAEHGHIDEAVDWWARALPDATPDILEAMRAIMPKIDHPSVRSLAASLAV